MPRASFLLAFTAACALLCARAQEEAEKPKGMTVFFKSEETQGTLTVDWLGRDGKLVQMGTIAPLQELVLREVGEGHEFVISDPATETAQEVVARSDRSTYFVFTPGGDPVRVVCHLERAAFLNINVHPEWSPRGAVRVLELVRRGHFTGNAITRVVPNFLAQFGISPDAATRKLINERPIPDDPPANRTGAPRFAEGMLSFAGSGENSRSSEMFFVMPGCSPEQLNTSGRTVGRRPSGGSPTWTACVWWGASTATATCPLGFWSRPPAHLGRLRLPQRCLPRPRHFRAAASSRRSDRSRSSDVEHGRPAGRTAVAHT